MFPTRVGKLRHGPLCEAAGGGGRTLDGDEGSWPRVSSLGWSTNSSRVSRLARRGLSLWAAGCRGQSQSQSQPQPVSKSATTRPRSSTRPGESVF